VALAQRGELADLGPRGPSPGDDPDRHPGAVVVTVDDRHLRAHHAQRARPQVGVVVQQPDIGRGQRDGGRRH
jgi:hypothetical protein